MDEINVVGDCAYISRRGLLIGSQPTLGNTVYTYHLRSSHDNIVTSPASIPCNTWGMLWVTEVQT